MVIIAGLAQRSGNKLPHLIAVAGLTACLSSGAHAEALTAELAKKCRDLAIKAHPPRPAGTNPYAQAERAYFNACVARHGEMSDDAAQKRPPPAGPE
jgi:hypothetical protein